MLVLPESEAMKYMQRISVTQALPPLESFLKGVHYIDNLQLSLTKKENGEPEHISLSFLLAKDHRLSESDCTFVIDVATSLIIFGFGWMWGYNKLIVKNPHPFEIKPLSIPLTTVNGFQILKCIEEDKHYDIAVTIQGLEIKSVDGTNFIR